MANLEANHGDCMRMIKYLLGAIALTSLLAGCTSRFIGEDPLFASTAEDAELAEAALGVTHAADRMAIVEREQDSIQLYPDDPTALYQYGLGRLASVDWSGPAEPLLAQIATRSHYRLKVFGTEPPIPTLVNINQHDVPLADILREMTHQLQDRVLVVIYPTNNIIELRYL
jgi:defect-in-organelle-trafficking protein DotD